mmetsp:Transcript_4682/g.13281  ORF Transcript_4682/g.13281 Transcript_4682/m.13281 type:complete len:325 (-) Transcript_4682:48-1022(-)
MRTGRSFLAATGAGGMPGTSSLAWKVVPIKPLLPSTPTIWPGKAARLSQSATLSCTLAPFADAREPSSSIERSLRRPSRPSQTMRPHRATSACAGAPTRPSPTPSPPRRACSAATMRPSTNESRRSRSAALSSSDSSIQLNASRRLPVHRAGSPRSRTSAGGSGAPLASSCFSSPELPSETEDLGVNLYCGFLTGSGETNSASPARSRSRSVRSLFEAGVTTSRAPAGPAGGRPPAPPPSMLSACVRRAPDARRPLRLAAPRCGSVFDSRNFPNSARRPASSCPCAVTKKSRSSSVKQCSAWSSFNLAWLPAGCFAMTSSSPIA